jgi:hypothetical protein
MAFTIIPIKQARQRHRADFPGFVQLSCVRRMANASIFLIVFLPLLLFRAGLKASVAAAGMSDGENLDACVAPAVRNDVVTDDQPARARADA